MNNTKEETEQNYTTPEITEEDVLAKMEELREFSHPTVTDEKLRQGARIALGLKDKFNT